MLLLLAACGDRISLSLFEDDEHHVGLWLMGCMHFGGFCFLTPPPPTPALQQFPSSSGISQPSPGRLQNWHQFALKYILYNSLYRSISFSASSSPLFVFFLLKMLFVFFSNFLFYLNFQRSFPPDKSIIHSWKIIPS